MRSFFKVQSKKDSGYALITTMMFSLVLLLVATFFTQTSKSYIQDTHEVNDYVRLQLKAASIKEELLFHLLTTPARYGLNGKSALQLPYEGANFFSQPFSFELEEGQKVTLVMQDTNGFLGLFSMSAFILEVLLEKEFGPEKAIIIKDSILDWIDADSIPNDYGSEEGVEDKPEPRNGSLQSISEIQFVPNVTPEVYNYLRRFITPTVNSFFNPLTAPMPLLQTFLDEDVAEAVQQKRMEGKLNGVNFQEMTGIGPTMWMKFSSGSQVLVKIIIEGKLSRYSESITVDLQPYLPFPYVIVSRNAVSP